MADKIEVVFGANIAGAVSGIKQLEQEIKSLVSPIAEIQKAFSGIGEALAGALAIEKIGEFINKMGELGEHAVNTGAALGITAEQFQTLNEQFELVGGSADSLVTTMRMLSRAVSSAESNPMSRQAQAFDALGISISEFAKKLRGTPEEVQEALQILQDAFNRWKAAGGNIGVEGPFGAFLGRNPAAVIALLTEGLDKTRDRVNQLGPPSQNELEKLKEMETEVHALGVAFENLKTSIIAGLAEPLKNAFEFLTKIIGTLGDFKDKWGLKREDYFPKAGEPGGGRPTIDIPGATEEEQRQLADIRQRENAGSYTGKNPKSTASGAYQMINETWRSWATSIGIPMDLYPTAQDAPAAIQDAVALYGLRKEGLTPWKASEVHSKLGVTSTTLPEVGVTASRRGGGIDTHAFDESYQAQKKAADDQLKAIDDETKARLAQLNFEKQAAQGNAEAVHAIEQQKIATVEEAEKRKQTVISSTSGVVRDALEKEHSGIVEGINLQTQALASDQKYHQKAVENANRLLEVRIKGLNAAEQEDLKQVEQRERYGRMTAQEAEAAERQIVAAHQRAVEEILQQEEKNAQGIHQIQERLGAEREAIQQQTDQKLKAIHDKYLDEELRKEHQINQTIADDLNSSLWSVITKQSTLLQAFEKLGQQLGEALTGSLLKQMTDAINPAGMLGLGNSGGGLSALMGLFGGGALSAGEAGAASGFGGAFGAGALDLGTIGAGGAAAGGGLSSLMAFLPLLALAHGGIIPSAAGGWAIPSFADGGMLAKLHSGEMVLPKDLSEGVQGMIRSGGGTSGGTINIHAMDTQTGAQFLMRNRNTVGQAFRQSSLTGGLSARQISNGRGSTGRF